PPASITCRRSATRSRGCGARRTRGSCSSRWNAASSDCDAGRRTVRILVVSSFPPRRCGIGAYARDQVLGLRAEGHDVTVLSPPDGGGELKVPFSAGRPFLRAARLARRFDRVIVHF